MAPAAPSRRGAVALGAICLVAAALRLAHVQQIQANDPFFTIPAVDGRLYDAWARRILAGDLLGDEVLVLGPLYPNFIALVYAVFGTSPLALKLVQALMGAGSCALVAVLARQHFGGRVARVAAAITAVYGMLIFYGGTLMIVNLQVPLVLLVLIATTRAQRRPTPVAWAATGLALGLSVLARQTVLLFAPLLVAWLLLHGRDRVPRLRRAALAGALCLGVAIPLLPFAMHNYVVGGDLVLVNSTGGANLYMGHNPQADGAWKPPRIARFRVDNPIAMRAAFTQYAEAETGRALKPSEVSAFWGRRALDWILANPGRWLGLELRKALLFVNAREVWNNRSIDVSRDFSWVLRLPLASFGVVAPLALLGLALAIRRWRRAFPLYAILGVYLASALIFFVLSRYRMASVPVLIIFAAFALVRLWDLARARRLRGLALAAAGLAGCALLVHLPLGTDSLYMAWFNVGNKYKDLSRWERAIESYHKSLELNPGFISTHNNLALAYEGASRTREAIDSWRRVLEWSVRTGDAARIERARRHLEGLGADADPPGSEAVNDPQRS